MSRNRDRTTTARWMAAATGIAFAAATTLTVVPAQAAPYDPATDPNSMAATTAYLGAPVWWNAGFTGRGIDVAVIDSGVAPVHGLHAPGKIINGPDLSLESQAPGLGYLDTYGHGTFMAGLLAGHDDALAAPYATAPASAYRGVAPDARIVSVKVATADGGTDVSQIIAAIYWVIQHRNDNGMNIRVLNLSYGTNSTQAYTIDPLAYAVEQAWKAGIVVVVAGGNSGYQTLKGSTALANPAFDPFVLAVGATDSNGTPAMSDDFVPAFSACSKFSGTRSVEFVAPGSHLQGLRVPNSGIDAKFPGARLGDRFFRGSGTSQSAAVVSGAVALVLQRYPQLSPDGVKSLFNATGYGIRGRLQCVGAGEMRLDAAFGRGTVTPVIWPWQGSTGTGTLEGSRGTDHISQGGVTLSGEKDVFGAAFNSAAIASAAGNSWTGGTWNGNTWTGNTWTGNTWTGNTWTGNTWTGNSWTSLGWTGNSWTGNTWTGSTWTGGSWSGSAWTGGSWSTGSWS